jgi:hypothetical protein
VAALPDSYYDAVHLLRIVFMQKIQQARQCLRGVFMGCKFQKAGFCCKNPREHFALV